MLGNVIVETCNNPGTGPVTPAGAQAGYVGFVQYFGSGAKAFYSLSDGTQTESGWTITGTTMNRNVIWTSAGGTAALNFTGACRMYCDLPAERWIYADDANLLQARNRRLANLAPATQAADAPQWRQIADKYLATYAATGGGITIPLPSSTDTFELDLRSVVMNAQSQLYIRISIDGGQSYLTGSSEYGYCVSRLSLSPVTYAGVTNISPLTAAASPVYDISGKIVIDPIYKKITGRIDAQNEINLVNNYWQSGSGIPPVVLIAGVNSPVAHGFAKLVQVGFGE